MPARKRPRLARCLCSLLVFFLFTLPLHSIEENGLLQEAPNPTRLFELYNSGEYEQAIEYASNGQEFDPWVSDWIVYKAKSLFATGQYEAAYEALSAHLEDRAYDLRARLLLFEAARYTDRVEDAQNQKDALGYLINERSRRYSYDPENIVAVGQVALLYQVEPKIILENFFRRAEEFSTPPLSAFLAIGDLALSKQDYKLASASFQKGLDLYPNSADLWFGLAASFVEGDRSKLLEYAENALRINPRHTPTRILIAEHLIAAESYSEASEQLDLVLRANPLSPAALALKATIAYIKNDNERGDTLRELALSTWSTNPEVDYRIGKLLSRKYRFRDGATSQSIALGLDPSYHPARVQLAQDLLRLGENNAAWPHAEAVHENDPYNIEAYNLVTLKDRLQNFATLESEHFIVRLSEEEAPVYGERALEVLEHAHATLSDRYNVVLPRKTTVEIYQNPADFETRTFGMPGNPGYLGVCFGPVFTVNSPATRSANWEAVLYHEFCHTITLTLSDNRMPRWLSEGISVYEEQLENPAWGQRMSANYRDRILSGNMQSISDMSSAFLRAQSGEDVQFAYYQSYLAVEYISEQFGMDAVRELLVSLGEGTEVNTAFAEHLTSLEALDDGFASYAKKKAAAMASDFRFDTTQGPSSLTFDLVQPKRNYTEQLEQAQSLLSAEKWQEAADQLESLIAEAGYLPGAENAHWHLAKAYRGMGDLEREAALLEEMTRHEANQLPPVTRLLELAHNRENAASINRWADAWIAINPMAETPWRDLLATAPSLEKTTQAIRAAQALLALETPDAPALHYELANLLADATPAIAKRHVLLALEEAPRFQKAYQLLAQLHERTQNSTTPSIDIDPLEGLDLNYDFTN